MKSMYFVVALLLVAQVGAQEMKSDKPASDSSMMKSDSMMKADSMMKTDSMTKSDSMMKADSMMKPDAMVSDADKMMSADPMDSSAYNLKGLGKQVVAFTTEQDAWKLAKSQTVVYFFAATWCPDCQATYKDLKAHFAQLPSTLTVVFVNYDKAKDLKKKYAITAQHTFVVVGPQGEKKKVWSGSTTVADLVKSATAMM